MILLCRATADETADSEQIGKARGGDPAGLLAGERGTRNDGPVSAYVDVRVDTVNPLPTIDSSGGIGPSVTIGSDLYVPSDFSVTVSASDDVAIQDVSCSPPDETRTQPDCNQSQVTETFDVVDQPDGNLTISATAHDCAGNEATATRNVKVDGTPPTSSVQQLPAVECNTSFEVSWSGQDNANGVGLKDYDVQYRDGEGSWTDWLTATTQTSATFTGQFGHAYYFQSRARDLLENEEAYPGGDGDTHTRTASVEIMTGGVQNPVHQVEIGTSTDPSASGNATFTIIGEHGVNIHAGLSLTATGERSDELIVPLSNGMARVFLTSGDCDGDAYTVGVRYGE